MNRNTTRKVVVCLALAFIAAPSARAVFGIGDIVFDPSNFEKAVQQLVEMGRHYEQLVRQVGLLKEQYEHMRRMAQQAPVNKSLRYRVLATRWHPSSATNTYGTTSGWISSINSGAATASGYLKAVHRLGQYGSVLSRVPADQQEHVKTSYATVELTDGANQHAIDTVGRLRANAVDTERAIYGLEEDSLSNDPNLNTEIAVLNKINAANIISVRTSQDTNKLLVALAEAQTVQAKRTRDAEARAINQHIRFISEGKSVMEAQAANASAAMLAWRMP